MVAGVCAPAAERDALALLGARDSKKLSDGQAERLSRAVREAYPSAVVAIGNRALQRALRQDGQPEPAARLGACTCHRESTRGDPDCSEIVSDQFGDARLLERALLERGRGVQLTQRHRAESDPIVAAASIVARAEFLRRLEALSTSVGMPLPKGAGPPVLAAGRAFVARHGADALGRVAKLHFKTTRQVTTEAERDERRRHPRRGPLARPPWRAADHRRALRHDRRHAGRRDLELDRAPVRDRTRLRHARQRGEGRTLPPSLRRAGPAPRSRLPLRHRLVLPAQEEVDQGAAC